MKIGIVAVSRDCFPESLSVNRRRALFEVFKYVGVPVEDLNYNQPKSVPYPTENPFA